ncbi:MAG: hypothetical protein H0V71_10775 [Chloroflexi bacterium]|nr:hypothetical protein [Chloroflexota bacterium]
MRLRFRDESGVALVMAVWILAFLMLTGSSLVFYAGSGASHAEVSTEDARALNLAEAGENYARAILYNAADPELSSAVGPGSLTLEGGTVGYSGTYDSTTKIWTLTGTGTHLNPTGAATPISRTVSSQVLVASSSGIGLAWGYVFADTTNCTTLGNNVTIDAPIYVRGDLCMQDSALITADLVQVRGKVQITESASIGTAAAPVAAVAVGGGCRYPWSGSYVTPCTSAQKVYRTAFSPIVLDLAKPALDFPSWYANAKPGPMSQTCTVGSFPGQFDNDGTLNRSNPMQNLFPSVPYDCQVRLGGPLGPVLGRIAYTPGSPGIFYIQGVVFFDGKLEFAGNFAGNKDVVYVGRGSIYASDTITIRNHVRFCASVGCDATLWNPNVNLLLLASGALSPISFIVENNTTWHGAIYAVNDYSQGSSAIVCGPIIAQELFIENNTDICYVPFTVGVPGLPWNSTPTIQLVNVPDSYTTD